MSPFRKQRTILAAVATFVAVAALAPSLYTHKLALIQHPLVHHFLPTYRSLSKLPDILFLPYLIFTHPSAETYNLSITTENIARLNDALPDNPFAGVSLEDGTKIWVPATFSASGYTSDIEVRYRGNQNRHWEGYKKSYLIKFPKDNLFRGMRELTLVIPDDRHYFAMHLNNYRAKKMGLVVPEVEVKSLRLNNIDHGAYLAFEHWSQEWLEKEAVEPSSILIGVGSHNDDSADFLPFYSVDGLPYWDAWNTDDRTRIEEFADPIIEIVRHADADTFEKLIPVVVDLNSFYARDVISILAGSYHNSGNTVSATSNLVLYFDALEGRLKPIPYNTNLVGEEAGFLGQPSLLQRRLWEVPAFKQARDELFATYVAENREDDIAFVDTWIDAYNTDFLHDSAKAENNFSYLHTIKTLYARMLNYFDDPFGKINDVASYPLPAREERPLEFSGSFIYLPQTILTPAQFVAQYPSFYRQGDTIYLGQGSHFFSSDVIIPRNTRLIILAGAQVYLAPGASLISYSPVEVRGSAVQPVRFQPAQQGKPWGVFAVINTEEDISTFTYLSLTSGQDDHINGVYFSGMLSLYNADGHISNSIFSDAHADDGINAKRSSLTLESSTFINNSSDGIDVDFAKASTTLTGNNFFDNYGDAIDISHSTMDIIGNYIVGCVDKGVSVGENSHPRITENVIAHCAIGIASKDLSVTTASNNTFIENDLTFSAYQKKPIYGGGTIEAVGGILWNNTRNAEADRVSHIELLHMRSEEPDTAPYPYAVRTRLMK